ncbi:MAG: hypothetical protein IH950_00480 [Bacteroidetes bacterium]|nr:hypothetical protein [Bacteroidota bacterium]
MAVPDDTYFGIDENGKGVYYRDVRSENNPLRRIKLLELRLRDLLIKQTNELEVLLDGSRKVHSPFPLAIITCISIETLGQIFYKSDNKKDEKNQSYSFVSVIKFFDKEFSRPLTKKFKESLTKRFPNDEVEKIKNFSELFYTYFRNTFIHGYKGRAVYLEEQVNTWEKGDGFLVINPNWFWRKFKETFEEHFNQLYSNKENNNPFKISAYYYIDKLIN